MFFIGAVILGTISLVSLPVELMPNIDLGRITVTTYVRGGLPSEEIEKRIAKPLEDALGDVSYLRTLLTISKEGESTVVLEFEPEANMNYVSMEVREKLSKVRDDLPQEAERPIVVQYGYGAFPIIAVTFTSEKFTPEALRKVVDTTIKEQFLRIDGVARIETVGGREEKILIELDEQKLLSLGLSFKDVLDTIGRSNVNLLGGELEKDEKKYLVRYLGEFKTISEIENLGILASPEGSIIRLKDIGKVHLSYLDPRELGRINLMPSVTLYIFKKSLSNTLGVCEEVERLSQKIDVQLGDDIGTLIPFNQGEFIRKAIKQLRFSLLAGAILAVLILFLFLKDILTIIILSLSIPFSLFITFSFMRIFGVSINVMSLAGLCLGGGMLLDSGIVVLENVFKHHERKGIIDKKEISASTREVSLPIFASVLTTLIVFLPFIFLNKETQRIYSGISLAITFSLIASLFISLSLIPLLASLLLTAKQRIKTTFFLGFQKRYKKSLNFILSFRYLVVIFAIIGVVNTIIMSQKLDKEFIGMPEEDKFTTFIQLPTGTRLEVTDKIVTKVEGFLEEYRQSGEVRNYTTHVEGYSAKIYVQLASIEERKKPLSQILDEMRTKTSDIEPAFIYYEEPHEVESKEIIIEFLGYDYGVLKGLATTAAAQMKSVSGLTDVKIRMREGGPQLDINLDKQKLAFWNFNTQWVATELHAKLKGLIPTRFHPKEDTYILSGISEGTAEAAEPLPLALYPRQAKELEIITRLQEKYRKKFKDIEETSLINPAGDTIKVSQLANLEFGMAESEIWRKNKKRMVQVSANRQNLALSKAADELEKSFQRTIELPEGYTWKFGENYDKMLRNQKELRFSFLLALILVYLVLASLFENMVLPLIILTSVPLAGVGSVNLLFIRKEPIGIGVLIGAIMLCGIVVNNAIILVDSIERLRKKGFGVRAAVVEAASLRLRPILMTTSTTILPLLPLLIFKTDASPLWAPLALTVVSGLIASCILTLYVIPSIYLFFKHK